MSEPEKPGTPTRAEQIRQQNRKRRLQRYQKVMELYNASYSLRAIARTLRMSRGTVRRFVRARGFPKRATPPRRSQIDPHVDCLHQRWKAGCNDPAGLYRELRDRDYAGSYPMVRHRVARWRDSSEAHATSGPKASAGSHSTAWRPSPTRVAWVLIREEDTLKDKELRLRRTLLERCEPLRSATALAHKFERIVHDQKADQLKD